MNVSLHQTSMKQLQGLNPYLNPILNPQQIAAERVKSEYAPIFTASLVESFKDDRIMHVLCVHDFIIVALKSGIVRIYDLQTRQFLSNLLDIREVCSSLISGEHVLLGAM